VGYNTVADDAALSYDNFIVVTDNMMMGNTQNNQNIHQAGSWLLQRQYDTIRYDARV